MILSRIKSSIRTAAFYRRNLCAFRRCRPFTSFSAGGITYRGYHQSDEQSISDLYFKLNGQKEFSLIFKTMYRLTGKKSLLVAALRQASAPSETIIGMNMYYQNPRDAEDNTVHEGFIGVLGEFEGRGIATQMRICAKAYFRDAGFSGISTRISKNNIGSLYSAEKLGFEVIKEYFDKVTGEERYYMICRLN